MHGSVSRRLGSALCTSLRSPHVFSQGHRRRTFHHYRRLKEHDNSSHLPTSARNGVADSPSESERASPAIPPSNPGSEAPDESPDKPPRPADQSNYGSASRRAGRNLKKPRDLPPVHLPPRFLENNVFLREDLQQSEKAVVDENHVPKPRPSQFTEASEFISARMAHWHHIARWRAAQRKALDPSILNIDTGILGEIESAVRVGLQPSRSASDNTKISGKPHLVLYCPMRGGLYHLHLLTKYLATTNDADVVQIDAQDVAEIETDPNDELRSLGYDVHGAPDGTLRSTKSVPDEEKSGTVADDNETPPRAPALAFTAPIVHLNAGSVSSVADFLTQNIQNGSGVAVSDSTRKLKLANFVDTLVQAADIKRLSSPSGKSEGDCNAKVPENAGVTPKDPQSTSLASPALIISVVDYAQMYETSNGGKVLDALHDVLHERRKAGQRILLVGSQDAGPASHKTARKNTIDDFDDGPTRTILIPSAENPGYDLSLRHDFARVKAINMRHLQDMLRRLASDSHQVHALVSGTSLWSTTGLGSDFDATQEIWTLYDVHRLATEILGWVPPGEVIDALDVGLALSELQKVDQTRYEWDQKVVQPALGHGDKKRSDFDTKMEAIRRNCNKYESKLLTGVVSPASIQTTFADVRASKETIETLKTLTSLSLMRPHAFTYGVLATDQIPGLLLYGPPGTGKTLLVQAVAKESGANVLEVSGA
ncbi:MAG: hypothetical protein Q9174_003989, partial [Haloplaca sp. 1 TL-2023]